MGRLSPRPSRAQSQRARGTLDWPHRDPFDRLIAATAIELSYPLVSDPERRDACGCRSRRPSVRRGSTRSRTGRPRSRSSSRPRVAGTPIGCGPSIGVIRDKCVPGTCGGDNPLRFPVTVWDIGFHRPRLPHRIAIPSEEVTFEHGKAAGAMPRRLIRGAKAVPRVAAWVGPARPRQKARSSMSAGSTPRS